MFGKRLKILREQRSMLQAELADILGLAPSTVSMYERGERDPDTNALIKIAKLFNVTTDFLLGKSDEYFAANMNGDYSKLPEEAKSDIEKYIIGSENYIEQLVKLDKIETVDVQDKREIIKFFVDKIVLKPDEIKIIYRF